MNKKVEIVSFPYDRIKEKIQCVYDVLKKCSDEFLPLILWYGTRPPENRLEWSSAC